MGTDWIYLPRLLYPDPDPGGRFAHLLL